MPWSLRWYQSYQEIDIAIISLPGLIAQAELTRDSAVFSRFALG